MLNSLNCIAIASFLNGFQRYKILLYFIYFSSHLNEIHSFLNFLLEWEIGYENVCKNSGTHVCFSCLSFLTFQIITWNFYPSSQS